MKFERKEPNSTRKLEKTQITYSKSKQNGWRHYKIFGFYWLRFSENDKFIKKPHHMMFKCNRLSRLRIIFRSSPDKTELTHCRTTNKTKKYKQWSISHYIIPIFCHRFSTWKLSLSCILFPIEYSMRDHI